MNAVLSLGALGNWSEVDARLSHIYSIWRDDLRFPVAAAMIGVARQDFDGAERSLRSLAEEAFRDPAKELFAEQYFHVGRLQLGRGEPLPKTLRTHRLTEISAPPTLD